MYKKNHSPAEKPNVLEVDGEKLSNPHQFTRVQHVIPQAHLKEWVNADGKLSIFGMEEPVRVDKAFYVDRLWSQWAEGKMLGANENNYFIQSRLIKAGSPISEHTHLTAYFCMLHARMVVTHKERPQYASIMTEPNIVPNKAYLEKVEASNAKSHVHEVMFGDDDSQAVARQLVTMHLQADYQRWVRYYESTQWEVFHIDLGRFIMPDFLQELLVMRRPILPITPQTIAIDSNLKRQLEKAGWLTERGINTILKAGVKKHYVQ
ncbi:hypothetical protein [Pseudomonas capeferrum]